MLHLPSIHLHPAEPPTNLGIRHENQRPGGSHIEGYLAVTSGPNLEQLDFQVKLLSRQKGMRMMTQNMKEHVVLIDPLVKTTVENGNSLQITPENEWNFPIFPREFPFFETHSLRTSAETISKTQREVSPPTLASYW